LVKVIGEKDYAYLKEKRRHWDPIFLLIAVAFLPFPDVGLFISLIILGIAAGKWRLCPSYPEAVMPKEIVAQALEKLSDEYYVVHDVKISPSSGKIDHIVFGPNGVFVLETKGNRGVVKCYGDTWYRASGSGAKGRWIKSPSHKVKNNAQQLYSFLKRSFGKVEFVKPIVVFSLSTIEIEEKDCMVEVVKAHRLVRKIENYGQALMYSDSDLFGMASRVVYGSNFQD